MKRLAMAVLVCLVVGVSLPALAADVDFIAPGTRKPDATTLVGPKNFYDGYEPLTPTGEINVIVEIPTGTNEKWEADRKDGSIKWEIKNGKPRIVEYLGYPANYGTIPKTLLPKELGGDGDAIDCIVLGPAYPRGSLVKAKLIGVLRLEDGGEQDDKLVAVPADGFFAKVSSIDDLNAKFPGIASIVETWFTNYKGPGGGLKSKGYGDAKAAKTLLDAVIKAFKDLRVQQ